MKKISFLIAVVVLLAVACRQNPKNQTVDIAGAKTAVTTLMDKYLVAFNARDVNALTALLADDGLYCGTDPNELMDKKTLSDAWNQALSDTSLNYNYSVDKREIRISTDATSAIVLEQFIIAGICPKIPFRLISHVVRSGDLWMFDFISWGFIPRNEDLGKLNKSLE